MALKLYRPLSVLEVQVDGSAVRLGSPADVQLRTMTAIQHARRWSAWKDQNWEAVYDLLSELVVGLPPEDVRRIPPEVAIGLLNLSSEQSAPSEDDLGKSDTP